jgi:AraC-like DNA-binding protein
MRHISIRTRMILSFLAIYLAPLIFVGLPGAFWMTKVARENAISNLNVKMTNVAKQISDSFDSIDNYVNQVSNDTLVLGIMHMRDLQQLYKRYSAVELSNFVYQLKMLTITSGIYDDLAICFPGKNFSITQRGTYSMEQLFSYEFFIPDMSFEDWLLLMGEGFQDSLLLPQVIMDTFGQKRVGLIYMRNVPPEYGNQPLLSAIFFISASRLNKIIEPIIAWKSYSISLTDKQGKPFFTIESEPNGNKDMIQSIFVGKQNWQIILQISEAELLSDVNNMNMIMLLLFIAMTTLGFISSILLTVMNYQPLGRIFSLLSDRGTLDKKHPSSIEMISIEQSLLAIIDRDESLQHEKDIHRDLLSYAALSRLLDGTLKTTPENCLKLFQSLDMPLAYPFFSIGVLSETTSNTIKVIVDACRDEMMNVYPVTQGEVQALLFNHMQRDDLRGIAESARITGACIGVSNPKKFLSELPDAFKEALKAVDYRPVHTRESMVFFEDVNDSSTTYYFPIETENRLVNLLRAHDQSLVMKEFEQLWDENVKSCSSQRALRRFLYDIEMTCQKLFALDDREWQQMFPDLQGDIAMENQKERIQQILQQCVNIKSQSASAEQENFLKKVRTYLDEHYRDPQLSLTSAAIDLNVTSAFLSRFIRKHFGIGYLEYVNQRRITLAKEYLRQNTVSIKELAVSVGFNNDVTFRRLFKKYEGITPSQYRI